MPPYYKHLLNINASVKDALQKLDALAADAILFLTDAENILLGSLTDGDLRRGFIKGLDFQSPLKLFIQPNPKFIQQGQFNLKEIVVLREQNFMVFPVVNHDKQIINIVNFRRQKSYLPVDALVMAGGRGERLRPLTNQVPKPLLQVGDKPILEHNLDGLNAFGIDDVWISLRYLGQQIVDTFKDGSAKGMRIHYVWEEHPLGTAGALALVEDFIHDYVLLMNSDLLTTINYEDFFLFFQEQEADLAVACIPYQVNVPYAVMETNGHVVNGLKEKPTYTHYSNAGIYLMKRDLVKSVPKHQHFNATDLMEQLISQGKKVVAYPMVGYWLDIGRKEDYQKAQRDIKNLKFS